MSKRIAYVTGGMGGIGTEISQRLFKDGFTVVAGCGPNSPRRERWLKEQEALGFSFAASEGNVSDWESTVAAFARGAVKRIVKPMMGFKSFRCARIILSCIELMHMIRKGQMQDERGIKTAAEQFNSLAA
ncbi:NAD(P)-dependent dehydrogenase (short-subunit alcohol dehydrogenase family) [Paraburkholderia sp. CI3]